MHKAVFYLNGSLYSSQEKTEIECTLQPSVYEQGVWLVGLGFLAYVLLIMMWGVVEVYMRGNTEIYVDPWGFAYIGAMAAIANWYRRWRRRGSEGEFDYLIEFLRETLEAEFVAPEEEL